MEPSQSLNQTAEEDIKKINETIEVLKMKIEQTLGSNLKEKVAELAKRHFERTKRLVHCEDDTSIKCIKLISEIALDTLMYDLIRKGLPLLIDGMKSGMIKAEDLPKVLEEINLMFETIETFRRFFMSLNEENFLKLAEFVASDKDFFNRFTNFLVKITAERKKLEQLLNEDREFAEKLRDVIPNLGELMVPQPGN